MKRLCIYLLFLSQFIYASQQEDTTTQQLSNYRDEIAVLEKIVMNPKGEDASIKNLWMAVNHRLSTRKKECDDVVCQRRLDITAVDSKVAVLQQRLSDLDEQWAQRKDCLFNKAQKELTRYQSLPLMIQWVEIDSGKFEGVTCPGEVVDCLNEKMNVSAMMEEYFFNPSKPEALALIEQKKLLTTFHRQRLIDGKDIMRFDLDHYQQHADEYDSLLLSFTKLLNDKSATKVQTLIRRFSAKCQVDRLRRKNQEEQAEKLEQEGMKVEEAYTRDILVQKAELERKRLEEVKRLADQLEQRRKNKENKKKSKQAFLEKVAQEKQAAEEKELQVRNAIQEARRQVRAASLAEVKKVEQEQEEQRLQEEAKRQEALKIITQQEREEALQQKKRDRRKRVKENKKIKKALDQKEEQELLSAGRGNYVVMDEASVSVYQDFRMAMDEDEVERNVYIEQLKKDKTLSLDEKRDRLYSFDKNVTRYHVKSFLDEYVDLVCDDEVNQNDVISLKRLIQNVLACHKKLSLKGVSVSWYISLYPDMYEEYNDRYQQLGKELSGKTLDALMKLHLNLYAARSDQEKQIEVVTNLLKNEKLDEKVSHQLKLRLKKEQELLASLDDKYEDNDLMICKKQIYDQMRLLQTTGGIFDMGRFSASVDMSARQERVILHDDFYARLFTLEDRIKAVLPSLECDISEQKKQSVYDIVESDLRDFLVAVGIPDRDCDSLILEMICSTYTLSKAYANYMVDIDGLKHHLHQLFVDYNSDGHYFSQAQVNDVIRMHIVLIKSFARIFYKK